MFVQSPPLGQIGLVPDLPNQVVPIGGWNNGRNMRFNDGFIERIPEPRKIADLFGTDTDEFAGQWLQQYEDSNAPRVVYATKTRLYRRNLANTAWDDVTRLSGPYTDSGTWQSFQWGTAVVFNNGIEPPQILYDGAANFVDLPNWGVLTSGDTSATCKSIRPFRNFMVAVDLVISGTRFPNAVWWSDAAVVDNDTTSFDAPSWDYEDASTLAGLNYVGVEDGPLIDSLTLNNNHVLYTATSAHLMQLVGGTFVFAFQRTLEYGLADIGAVTAYNNVHFCVGPDTIYIHDGSTVSQIADGRIQKAWFDNIDLSQRITCEENLKTKEVHTLYTAAGTRRYLIYNYKDDNWSFGDATVWDGVQSRFVNCMSYGFRQIDNLTWDTVTETWNLIDASWSSLQRDGLEQSILWLTEDAYHKAEDRFFDDPGKDYFITKNAIDFSELNPQFTSDRWKYLRQIYPHIDAESDTEFRVTWSANLAGPTDPNSTTVLVPYDASAGEYKVDLRATGRYLNMEITVTGDGRWRMSSMDYDMEVTHGR